MQSVQALKNKILSLLAAVTLCSAPAFAHHGWSEYDQTKAVTLSGQIESSGYEHPHGVIQLMTADKKWTVVLAPPFRMENRGLAKQAIAVGQTVTVEGYINRRDANELRAERVTASGKTVELR